MQKFYHLQIPSLPPKIRKVNIVYINTVTILIFIAKKPVATFARLPLLINFWLTRILLVNRILVLNGLFNTCVQIKVKKLDAIYLFKML